VLVLSLINSSIHDMFKLNFKIALRNLRRNISFSLINIGGLAIGMTCCLLLLLYINYEWNFDKQFKDIDRVYFSRLNLDINGKLVTSIATPNKLAAEAKQTVPGIELASRMALGGDDNKLFNHGRQSFKLESRSVDPSYLQIFNYPFIHGNAATALSTPDAVVITEATAKKLFGNQNPMGQTLKYDNRKLLKVSGVLKDLPKNQSLQFDALLSWAFFDQEHPGDKENGWGAITCATVFKLKKEADFAATDAAIRKMIRSHDPDTQLEAFLFPYAKFHLYNVFENGKPAGGRIEQVRLFGFLAFCILLIAGINYMNLSTARSEKRSREVGVRKALGSTRKTIMGQFMLESVLFSFLATVVAFGLLELCLPYFNNLLDISMSIDYRSFQLWGTLAALTLITGFLAGSYPAFYLSSFIPVRVLKGNTNIGKSSLPVRKVLVVLQFTLSICMIICAIVVYSQISFMKNAPLGFAKDNLVQMPLEGLYKNPERLKLFKSELQKSGAIVSAAEFAQSFTESGEITSSFSWPGKPANDNSIFDFRSVGYDFTKTIGARMVSGRDFSPEFPADSSASILINQSLADKMGIKNPVGTSVKWDDNSSLKIIGVVENYLNEALGRKALPTFFYYNPVRSRSLLLRLNPEQNLTAAMGTIKRISQQLNPAYPLQLTFVDQDMADKLKTEHLLSVLSNLFGGFAILISCLGLFGLALYMAEQRKKEISIRKVLGADLSGILILLNKDFMKLVLLSNVIAFPIAYILTSNWLKNYDYKIPFAVDPFVAAALISIGIALLTVSLQSFKVAKANAVDALKYE